MIYLNQSNVEKEGRNVREVKRIALETFSSTE